MVIEAVELGRTMPPRGRLPGYGRTAHRRDQGHLGAIAALDDGTAAKATIVMLAGGKAQENETRARYKRSRDLFLTKPNSPGFDLLRLVDELGRARPRQLRGGKSRYGAKPLVAPGESVSDHLHDRRHTECAT